MLRIIALVLGLAAALPLQAQQGGTAGEAMTGISNQGKNPTDPYVTAGDRAYLIGTQDGNFPDLGEHLPGEMGGLWLHPIKLIDGFKASVVDSATGRETDLEKSTEFINYPYGNRFSYGKPVEDVEIDRFQFSPDGHPGIVVQYRFVNTGESRRALSLRLTASTGGLPSGAQWGTRLVSASPPRPRSPAPAWESRPLPATRSQSRPGTPQC
jgi:hypothetical protein